MLKSKKLTELILFLSVFLIYCLSASKTINFWDSSEFIASSYTLQASHPPGSPFYTLLCKTIISFFPNHYAAYVSNLISAFFGALTVVLLFKITHLIALRSLSEKLALKKNTVSILCGLLASLSLAFSNSFWTASIETEVYTLSFAVMNTLIYVMLLWDKTASKKQELRLLLLFVFCLGIAVGIHLILVAIVIPCSILIVSKKYKLTFLNFFIGLFAGLLFFFALYGILIKGTINASAALDIYFVNTLKLEVNSGALSFLILFFILVIALIILSAKKKWFKIHYTSLSVLLFFIGMSSYLMPIQRSNINTLVAKSLHTSKRLSSYINAERFGVSQTPLFYGKTYNAELDIMRPFKNIEPQYTYDKEEKRYIKVHDGVSKEVNYSNKFKMYFPRVYDSNNASNYAAWTPIKGKEVQHMVNGNIETIMKPTFKENFSFFINYQVVWLNTRYLFWNFIGKQNDYHGLGYLKNGNWISGFNFIDKYRVGDVSLMPDYYKNNKGNDAYYFLPFLLGLLGLFALRKKKTYFWTSIFLFLTFGLGITIYINPLPTSILVRERDYILIGSFIIFSLWIGLSLLFFVQISSKRTQLKTSIWVATLGLFLASPIQLFAKGWDNHQNKHDRFAYDLGKAYLDSCPKQTILITNGDNMTFPLWYLQDVEGYRKDVRVINFDQLNIDTHIDNLKQKKHKSLPIKIDLNKELYIDGAEKLIPLHKETDNPIDLKILSEFLNSDKTLINWNNTMRHYIPGTNFSIPIDSAKSNDTLISKSYNVSSMPSITWEFNKNFYGLNDIILLNIIKNNISRRPICFANNSKLSHYIGLDKNVIQEGLVSTLVPIKRNSSNLNPKLVNTESSYEILIETKRFAGLNSTNSYIRDENRSYSKEILRQNYYFLAQALFEEKKNIKAKRVLDQCLELFPNETIPFHQYAFALGKLYVRMGYPDVGNKTCITSMKNIMDELKWMTSFDPPNAIINVRHANKLYKMYTQMLNQLGAFNEIEAKTKRQELSLFSAKLDRWQKNNWPY